MPQIQDSFNTPLSNKIAKSSLGYLSPSASSPNLSFVGDRPRTDDPRRQTEHDTLSDAGSRQSLDAQSVTSLGKSQDFDPSFVHLQSEASQLPAQDRERFHHFVSAFALVSFDIDHGPVLSGLWPESFSLSATQRASLLAGAFPDTNPRSALVFSFSIPPTFNAFVYFERVPTSQNRRGFEQRSLILLTTLERPALSFHIIRIIGQTFLAQQTPSHQPILRAISEIAHWPIHLTNEDSTCLNHEETNTKESVDLLDDRISVAHFYSRLPATPLTALVSASLISLLWELWEIALLSKPLIIFGSDPTIVSELVWAVRALLQPLSLPESASSVNPYLTLSSPTYASFICPKSEASPYGSPLPKSNRLPTNRSFIVGITNPWIRTSITLSQPTVSVLDVTSQCSKELRLIPNFSGRSAAYSQGVAVATLSSPVVRRSSASPGAVLPSSPLAIFRASLTKPPGGLSRSSTFSNISSTFQKPLQSACLLSTNFQRAVSKDRALLTRLMDMYSSSSSSFSFDKSANARPDLQSQSCSAQRDCIQSAMLYKHFHSQTERFLAPLHTYFQTLIPLSGVGHLAPFSLPDFQAHVKQYGSALSFKPRPTQGLSSSMVRAQFYERWWSTPLFGRFLAEKIASRDHTVANHEQRNGSDLTAYTKQRKERTITDIWPDLDTRVPPEELQRRLVHS